MLQPKVVRDLRLHDYGYRAIPLDPAYAALTADGPIFFDETARTSESIARQSAADAAAYPEFEALLARTADFLRPMLLREAPALGSKRPRRHRPLLRDAARCGPRAPRAHDLVRMFTMSVGDLLDDHFELDGLGDRWPRPESSESGQACARPAPPTTCCTMRSGSLTASPAPGGR